MNTKRKDFLAVTSIFTLTYATKKKRRIQRAFLIWLLKGRYEVANYDQLPFLVKSTVRSVFDS